MPFKLKEASYEYGSRKKALQTIVMQSLLFLFAYFIDVPTGY